MKPIVRQAACVAAIVVAACAPSPGRAQSLMMGADGAIHLDGQGGDASAPIVINETPELIQSPGVQMWTSGQPIMGAPYGMGSPQCISCAPVVAAPQANLGPLARLRKADPQWVVGAEALYARASFSDATSYLSVDNASNTIEVNQFDFDFDPSYSIYGGVFISQWGGAVMFDYTRLESDASVAAETSAANEILFVSGASNVSGSADVNLKTYDLSFSKSLFLGGESPASAGCAPAPWEPAWELGFEGGMRFANVNWSRSVFGFDPATGESDGNTQSQLDFDGFGPRIGVLGRRYFGRRGLLSVYAKGDWSLLWGDVDFTDSAASVSDLESLVVRNGRQQIVPVTEIELGATANIGRIASISGGYFWMAWHDLGMPRDIFASSLFPGENANILGFDGLFLRGEVAY